MKKVKWDSLPTATPTKKGLMSMESVLGQPNYAVKQIKLTDANTGFLIKTSIPVTAAYNTIVRITENNFTNSGPGYRIVQAYPSTRNALATIKHGSCSALEVINLDGFFCFYVTPVSGAGYSAIIEVYAINTNSNIINPEIEIQKIGRPAGALTIDTLI